MCFVGLSTVHTVLYIISLRVHSDSTVHSGLYSVYQLSFDVMSSFTDFVNLGVLSCTVQQKFLFHGEFYCFVKIPVLILRPQTANNKTHHTPYLNFFMKM